MLRSPGGGVLAADQGVRAGEGPLSLDAAHGQRPGAVSQLRDAAVGGQDEPAVLGLQAVLGDQVEMARFLISKGAGVNHVDTNGMTALLYAASIDFGSPAMIDMLLKAGARTGMKTKEGKTALELARQYKHTHLIASLSGGATN